MHCIAIIEAAKRASESDCKEKLIAFLEDQSKQVLHQMDIPLISEINTWNGEEWIKHLNEENPLITSAILDEFENVLRDELTKYALCQDIIAGHHIYELCGVFWRINNEDDEVEGPTTDKELIYGYFG